MTHTRSRQIKAAYLAYLNSDARNLAQVYGRYSIYKTRAFGYCQYLVEEHKHTIDNPDLRIISHNAQTFSAGFIGEYPHPKTGELYPAFFYITKDYNRVIFLQELPNPAYNYMRGVWEY